MKKVVDRTISIIICIIMLLIVLLPFYVVILAGTYNTQSLGKVVSLVPGPDFLYNLNLAFSGGRLIYWILNSVYIGVARAVVTCIVCLMCGYGLSKYQFPGSRILSSLIVATLMIPTSLGLVALLFEFRKMGWIDTHLPLIFANAGNAFAAFWFKQNTDAVPNDLIDSARIDGSTELNTFFRIAIPIMKPSIATISIITFINSWNDFVMPSIVLQTSQKFTIPVGMTLVNALYRTEHSPKLLVVVLGIIPILIVYLCFSKMIIKGLTAGSVKE